MWHVQHYMTLKVALDRTQEHLCHSMIMDPLDSIWKQHFTNGELDEIFAYERKALPSFDKKLQEHLDSYNDHMATPLALFPQSSQLLDPGLTQLFTQDSIWNKNSLVTIWRPSSAMMRRYVLFDSFQLFCIFLGTNINTTTGDIVGKSSTKSINLERTLEARKKMGPRLDLIFRSGVGEVLGVSGWI